MRKRRLDADLYNSPIVVHVPMTEEEAKTIIREDAPDGNVRKRIEAIQVAVRILGNDCTMADVWKWAEQFSCQ